MAKVIVGTTMSLDGFISDRTGSLARLYPDMEELHNTPMLRESMLRTGAALMGRHTFDMAQGDFTGYEYQVPIFVLTHHPPNQITKGQNDRLKIIFVQDGIESAVRQAQAAAGDKDVTVVGGASAAQQIMNAGLFDELQLGIVPIVLGDGLRFFQYGSVEDGKFEQIRIYESRSRIDICYRLIR